MIFGKYQNEIWLLIFKGSRIQGNPNLHIPHILYICKTSMLLGGDYATNSEKKTKSRKI